MIHYHGTPFSGDMRTRLALRGKHAMVSYARPDDIEIAAEVCQSFALDNGAFTAWQKGEDYDAREYVKWAKHWLRHPGCDFAIAPDVIDGSEKDNKFMLRLVDHNAKWVPVWHLHESIDRLRELAYVWHRVALGSSGQWPTPGTSGWWGRIAEAMKFLTDGDGYPICKIHGLRMLDSVLFSHIPFSSADSTNVARNIGIDSRWKGPYVPPSKQARALIMIDRIESHASAHRWNKESKGVAQNYDLFG